MHCSNRHKQDAFQRVTALIICTDDTANWTRLSTFSNVIISFIKSVYGLFKILRTVLFTITSQTQNPETHMCKNFHINNFWKTDHSHTIFSGWPVFQKMFTCLRTEAFDFATSFLCHRHIQSMDSQVSVKVISVASRDENYSVSQKKLDRYD